MNNLAKKIIGLTLVAAMLVPLASCKPKSKEKARIISADDPYFSIKEIDLYKAANQNTSVSYNMIPMGDEVAVVLDIYEYDDGGMIDPRKYEEYAASEPNVAEDETKPGDGESDDSDTPETEPVGDEPVDTGDDGIVYPEYPSPYNDNVRRELLVYDLDGNRLGSSDITSLFGESSYFQSVKWDGKDNLVFALETYSEEKMQSEQTLVTIDRNGKEVKPRMKLEPGTNQWFSSLIFDNQGNLYISMYGETGTSITIYDAQRTKMFTIEEKGMGSSFYNVDGTIYIDSYGTGDKYEYNFYPIDLTTRKLGAPIDMIGLSIGSSMPGGNGLYLNKAGGIFAYDIETKTETEILAWKDTDLDLSKYAYAGFVPFSTDKFVTVNQYYNYLVDMRGPQEPEPIKMIVLTREQTNPNAGKKILVLGGIGLMYDQNVTAQVYQFNRENAECRIELRDYEDQINYADFMDKEYTEWMKAYAAISEKIYLEMINGEGPDIIATGYYLSSLERFEAKELLTDLYALAKKDESFNKEDYVQSVLSLFERKGKLYQFPVSFSLSGLVGPTRFIGSRTGWTVDEFNEMVNGLPEGVYTLVNITKTDLLTACVSSSMNYFADYAENEVRFDSLDFQKLLEFAKTYGQDESSNGPRPMEYTEYDESEYVDEYALMSQGKLALTRTSLYGPRTVADIRYNFGEPVTFIGYPSGNKSGLSCTVTQRFAISDSCASKDAAWDFVRHFLSEETQKEMGIYSESPINKAALDHQIDQLLNPPEDDGEFIPYDYYYGYGAQITQEDVNQYMAMIDAVTMVEGEDEQILSIIFEETPDFFKGLKSAEDVSKIIQDRVKTFVSERS